MSTYWQIKLYNIKKNENLKHLIQKSLDKDENMLSSWKKNSIVSQFNHKKKINCN